MIVKDLLKNYQRLDDRELLRKRDFKIEKLENFFVITFGDTQIMGMYYITNVQPYIDKPNEGIVSFSCISNTKRTDRLTGFLKKIYVNQKCIDLETLCVKYGKECKSIFIELRIFHSDGELFEPSILLINHILDYLNISMNFIPTCFYFIAIDDVIIRDPLEIEDLEKDWSYLIVNKSKNEYIYIEKIGKENTLEDIYQVLEITSSAL